MPEKNSAQTVPEDQFIENRCRVVQAALDSLSANIAILDERGIIRYTNRSWKEHARENGLDPDKCSEGINYLKVTLNAKGEPTELTEKIKSVMRRESDYYEKEYPCHGPDKKSWYRMKVTPYDDEGPYAVVIAHEDITEKKKGELKIEESLQKTKMLHDQFLPAGPPDIPGLDFAFHYQPANRLGGDFYNYVRLENKLIFYVSDVSGHDLSSSILNIFLREAINSYLLSASYSDEIKPADIVSYVSGRFSEEEFPADYFISLVMGVMDLETNEINLVNAGFHFPPKLILESSRPASLKCSGHPISYLTTSSEQKPEECRFILSENSTLLIYTDGLIEQRKAESSQEMYGEMRLLELITSLDYRRPETLINKTCENLKQFRGETPVGDDITMMAIKNKSLK